MKRFDIHSKNYQRRTLLLMGSMVLLYFLAYRLAIRETLHLKTAGEEMVTSIERLEDAPERIARLEQSLDQLESLLGQYYGRSSDIQEDMLNDLTVYCQDNRLTIREVPSTHSIHKMVYQMETCQIIIEGRYLELLKLLHHLETNFYQGRLFSVSFIKKTDLKTKRNYLVLKIFIQNIKESSDEKT